MTDQPVTPFIDTILSNSLMRVVDRAILESILPDFEPITLAAGATLFEQGDPPDGYYLIEAGTMKITSEDMTLNQLFAGQGFGEMALLSGQTRTATAEAETEVKLLKMSNAGFIKLIDAQPGLIDEFTRTIQARTRRSMLSYVLRRVIGDLDSALLRELEGQLGWESYEPGDIILEQNMPGDDMLFVISGRVRATLVDGYESRVLGDVGSGGIVGELALLSTQPRSATITAVRRTTVARMNAEGFERITAAYPSFATRLMRIIVERQQRNLDQHHVEKPTSLNITLAPTNPGVNLQDFAQRWLPYLQKHGSVLLLDRQRFEALYGVQGIVEYGDNHPAAVVLQRWLDEIEQRYDYVVFIPDGEWTPWTKRAVNNADRILLIADAAGNPQPGRLEQTLREQVPQQRYELVLLHPEDTAQPAGTAQWLDAHHVRRHHHIRANDDAHFARLARIMTGNGIGLVLGGGGARGYVHMGVIKAIIEAQLPIDAIGAVSMGAVMGGALQRFMNILEMEAQLQQFGSRRQIFDFTFPLSALNRSKKVTDAMKNVYGEHRIEDGWLPFFCISTDLQDASMIVDRRGLMYKAIRASLSIPGVFSPVERDGHLVIDGGVMNNFPVDLMREYLEGGTVIGTLVAKGERSGAYGLDDYVDGWRAFFGGIVPGMKRQRVPSILKTILSASSVNSYQRLLEYKQRTDVLLVTDTAPYGMLDFDEHEELVKRGYEAHRARLAEWVRENARLVDQPPMW